MEILNIFPTRPISLKLHIFIRNFNFELFRNMKTVPFQVHVTDGDLRLVTVLHQMMVCNFIILLQGASSVRRALTRMYISRA